MKDVIMRFCRGYMIGVKMYCTVIFGIYMVIYGFFKYKEDLEEEMMR